eukprot:2140782-Rhodomonas_salina.3
MRRDQVVLTPEAYFADVCASSRASAAAEKKAAVAKVDARPKVMSGSERYRPTRSRAMSGTDIACADRMSGTNIVYTDRMSGTNIALYPIILRPFILHIRSPTIQRIRCPTALRIPRTAQPILTYGTLLPGHRPTHVGRVRVQRGRVGGFLPGASIYGDNAPVCGGMRVRLSNRATMAGADPERDPPCRRRAHGT